MPSKTKITQDNSVPELKGPIVKKQKTNKNKEDEKSTFFIPNIL
jgi:hypothetical protein